MSYFKAVPRDFPRGTDEKYEKSVRIAGIRTEIRRRDIPYQPLHGRRIGTVVVGIMKLERSAMKYSSRPVPRK
jgi:hypothetical protein